ncbi:unnamed protein product [Blepharisma stoltei]|uniref:Uncharacterized protein n=1 Tax=Blepharisma stoltei TaxID=1481888 RepID=A0AAU9IVI9_9CILI|nr:unnamed protein product [Blepharisma stoltei]
MLPSKSITYGNKGSFRKTIFQAAAISTYSKEDAYEKMNSFKSIGTGCIWAGIIYRVKESEDFYEEIKGVGQKLLSLASKMGISDIVLGVRIWEKGEISSYDLARMVLERAKELIDYIFSLPEPIVPPPPNPPSVHIKTPSPSPSPYPSTISRAPTPRQPKKIESELDRALKRLYKIVDEIQETDMATMKELVNHSHIGKVLFGLHSLIEKDPSLKRSVKFFELKDVKKLMHRLDPTTISNFKLNQTIFALKSRPKVNFHSLEKISHCAALIYKYLKTFINISHGNYTDVFALKFEKEEKKLPKLKKKLTTLSNTPRIWKPRLKERGSHLPFKEMAFSFEEYMVPHPVGIFEDRFASELDHYDKKFGRRSLDLDENIKKKEIKLKNLMKIDKLVDRTLNKSIAVEVSKEEAEFIMDEQDLEDQPINKLMGLVQVLEESRKKRDSLAE